MKDLPELLSDVKMFSETESEVLDALASQLKEIPVRPGHIIFRKGDEGNAMYIIKSGSVRVHDGNHVLSRLSAGQVFGEFALFDNETRSASVTAEEKTVLLELQQEDFLRVVAGKAEVTAGVLRNVIRRIREMNELESKLAKSYLKIQKQKLEIEEQHNNILAQKSEVEKINEQLSTIIEEKNRLISVVSHGLRNPLTSSLCVADLIENDPEPLPDPHHEYFNLIHSSLRRMNSLINQTLDIDVIELQRDNLNMEQIDLAELLHQIAESFRYTLKLKKLEIDMKVQKLQARVDRNFFYLVIDNLLSNAIKFSPPDKSIIIDLLEKEGQAIIEISDEGPGMTDQALKILFDDPRIHGRQTDKTGLFIVKKYVEAMGGTISCKSRQGQGTTFHLRFDIQAKP
jgi:signal transduction histidine kinase